MYLEPPLVSLEELLPAAAAGQHSTVRRYPFRITRGLAERIAASPDGVAPQFLPDPAELADDAVADPLAEEQFSPLPGLVHRYPDRVLFLISERCAAYCRFCTRKRRLHGPFPGRDSLYQRIAYIRRNERIRDVLLSGGDPLLLPNSLLKEVLDALSGIERLDLIRIGTRTLSVWPERFDPETVKLLGSYPRLWINVHFNHPDEFGPAAVAAAEVLHRAGIPLANQSVLLRGINDDAQVLSSLQRLLLRNRIRPYYLHMMDLTRGTGHFRVKLHRALQIYRQLQGYLSGMALPRLMLDLPGGGGKIPLLPEYVVSEEGGVWTFVNYCGEQYSYDERGVADG